MPYVIAFVIIIVAAGALLLFREPVEAPVVTTEDEVRVEETQMNPDVPEGFTPPTTPPPSSNQDVETEATEESEAAAATPTQTYVAEASYFTPRRTEHEMDITFELEGETVVGVNVMYDGEPAATPNHMAFDNAYTSVVIGQNINTLELSRVGGASLTSEAFNEAVAEVRAQL